MPPFWPAPFKILKNSLIDLQVSSPWTQEIHFPRFDQALSIAVVDIKKIANEN